MKKLLITILLFFQVLYLFAQDHKQECINLTHLKGSTLFLHTTTSRLIEFAGNPDSFTLDRELEIFHYDSMQTPDYYKIIVNSLAYKDFVYLEKGDSVWIHSVHFDNKHYYSIVYEDVTFSQYLHIKDFFRYFQVQELNIVLLNKQKLFAGAKDRVYYTQVALPVCESKDSESIQFYFDRKGYLESIAFQVFR
ncbi:MAG: hypothetical protein LBK03_01430 [Bacteroidales bacterium]|nr:hypothetical protein [Bacteroidales bacterium]